jgi:hypothetical protein
MNVKTDHANGYITVTLSRRNLMTLLLKLDEPNSVRTLERLTESGDYLRVTAEDDLQHYGDRQPGRMHPREEERL